MRLEGDSFVHSTLEEGYDFRIRDQWKRECHFKISSFPCPVGFLSEAIEVKSDDSPPQIFTVLSGPDDDIERSELMLKAKIKKGINRRHLKKDGSKWRIGERRRLRGRIEWNDDFADTRFDRIFVVDGKRITFEMFAAMFDEWEGFHFNFSIIERTDADT